MVHGRKDGCQPWSIDYGQYNHKRAKACQKSGPGSLACSGEAFFWLDVWLLCI
jgi:hypothetical protein